VIRIITDSTIYIKKNDADELKVKIVPINYVVNEKLFYESFSDDNENFEELINSNNRISTSQPNPAAFVNMFEEELALGNEILCITISSRLSGTYNSASMAANQIDGGNVYVFDSHLTAGVLYLLVRKAKKMIDNGEKIIDIITKLTEIRENISIIFSVDDMKPLRNSGRIGFVRMSVGTILNIKPILLCKDGIVVADSVAHGTNEAIKKLVDKIPSNATEVIVNYISNNRVASNLYNVIKSKYPQMKTNLSKMGPVLGVHLGLQVVAVSFIVE